MTEYVKSTNFTSKDSLASGNPLKLVKGTEFDIEFNNIATAVTSKADLIDPAFTGVPTAPTAAAGTNTTQIATTAFVATATAALQALFPVGSIYMNASVTTNPGTLLGFGTWTAFGAGRVMVGLNSSDALFDALEETGGSKDATVVSHTHTASSSSSSSFSGNALPAHAHTYGTGTDGASAGFPSITAANTTATSSSVSAGTPSGSVSTSTSTTVNSTGSSGTNANLQPYITVAMWKRTA